MRGGAPRRASRYGVRTWNRRTGADGTFPPTHPVDIRRGAIVYGPDFPWRAVALVALAGCASSNPFAALSRDKGASTPPPLFAESGGKSASKNGASRGPFGLNLKESSEVAQSIQQGENAESEGRLEEARGLYERALTFDPDNSRAHHRLATIHDRREDFTQARRHYQAALKKTPKNPDVLSDLGYSCQLQGRDEESETHLREALKHDAKHRQALFNLGNLYARHGRTEDALSLYRRAGNEEEAQAALAQASSGSIGVRTASHRPTEAQIVQTESTSAPAAEKKKYPNAATRKLAENSSAASRRRPHRSVLAKRRPSPAALMPWPKRSGSIRKTPATPKCKT